MLFDQLNENAEFITLACPNNDVVKIKEHKEVFKDLIDNDAFFDIIKKYHDTSLNDSDSDDDWANKMKEIVKQKKGDK